MRDLHARMLAALLGGEGLRGIAELAAEEAGGPVAIVLPARGLADASSGDLPLEELSQVAAERLRGGASTMPQQVELEHQVVAGERPLGYVLALHASTNGLPAVAVDRQEVLRTTALAALAEVAVNEARDVVAEEVRGSLLEDLRAGRVEAQETARGPRGSAATWGAARSPWSPRCARPAPATPPP